MFRLEKGEERSGDVHEAGKVDGHLLVEGREVDLLRLGKVMYGLNASIEEDAVKVGIGARHLFHESVQALTVCDVIRDTASFTAMLLDELVDSVLSAADCYDIRTFVDELLS